MKWHETCTCECRLDASVCYSKRRWNRDKCRCECKELIKKGRYDKGFIWRPSNCECEYEKLCNVGEYLDYKSCKCRKKLVDNLFEDYSENIDENEMIYNGNYHENVVSSCTAYIVLFAINFFIIIGISSVFIYSRWFFEESNTVTGTIIY